jgi:hypothetical protein
MPQHQERRHEDLTDRPDGSQCETASRHDPAGQGGALQGAQELDGEDVIRGAKLGSGSMIGSGKRLPEIQRQIGCVGVVHDEDL